MMRLVHPHNGNMAYGQVHGQDTLPVWAWKITACQTMQSTFTLHAGIEQHAAAVCGCCCQHVTTWVPRHCSHAAAVALPD